MTNAEYLHNFTALSDQLMHLHGEFSVDHVYMTGRIEKNGENSNNAGQRAIMTLTLQEEYLAMKFFLHSDKRRYGTLVANTQNDFVIGIDKYPKTVNKAYDMLVNFVNSNKPHGNDH